MLFIHGSLAMGGVETFFIRMAKQRAAENKDTIIILLSNAEKSDIELLAQARKYATVLFLKDLTYLPNFLLKFYPFHLCLLLPLNSAFTRLLKNVDSVHVSCAICAFFYMRIAHAMPDNIKFTIGLYHSLEFCWGNKSKLPYFERENRKFFYEKIDNKNIIFFNETMIPFYEAFSRQSFKDVNLFPLGVISNNLTTPCLEATCTETKGNTATLKLVSVGRLVAFKTYNLHMLNVLKQLKAKGVSFSYDIYGDGPLEAEMQQKIAEYELKDCVSLKGRLNYSKFAEIISSYDIFVGSGTSIIEASSLGVCSIVGIENCPEAETYDFFANLPGFSYNEDGLFEKRPIIEILEYYEKLNEVEKNKLSNQHVTKAMLFSMAACSANFDKTPFISISPNVIKYYLSKIFRLRYSLSFFYTSIKSLLCSSSLSDQVRRGA